MTYRMHANDAREVLLPRTIPARTLDDMKPYHWVLNEAGRLSLREGPPPKDIRDAAAAYASGTGTLNDLLDRIGVPKGRP